MRRRCASAVSPSRSDPGERGEGEVHATAGRSAYVFGPERSGLETDDVALAHSASITMPINPEFGSPTLNLAQAVILLA